MKKILWLVSLTLLLVHGLSGCQSQAESNDVRLELVDGKQVSTAHLEGKALIINYWASWCPPCQKEIPEFNAFAKKHQNEALVLAYNFDALSKEEIKKAQKSAGISYPSLAFAPTQALHLDEPIGLPVTYVFNAKGQLVKTLYHSQTLSSLEKALLKA